MSLRLENLTVRLGDRPVVALNLTIAQGEIVTLDLRQGVVHRGARSHNPETIGSML